MDEQDDERRARTNGVDEWATNGDAEWGRTNGRMETMNKRTNGGENRERRSGEMAANGGRREEGEGRE